MVWGLKRVAMARHGLILSQDGATSLRKVFKYLPGLRDTIKKSKMAEKSQNPELQDSPLSYYLLLFGVSRWCHMYSNLTLL